MVAIAGRARPLATWPLLAALLGLPCPARAQPATSVRVSVDATATGTPLERVWPFYGYDELNYTTSPEGRALLATLVSANTAPVHVRNHFLFNSGDGTPAMKWGSTNVYSEDSTGSPVYSWPLTDEIVDAITAAGAYPFVELGFMPEALSSHPTPYVNSSTISLNGGCFYPPTDYTKWANLIRAWTLHANASHPDVAARWLWELWNEPDSGYWHGTFDDYAKLYDYAESALHEVLPDAALGGPAVIDPNGSFLPQFLDHCANGSNAVTGDRGTRLDLVTFHAKGGVSAAGDHVEMDLGNQLRLHRAGFEAVAAFPQFKQTPIYITEADPDGCAACPTSIVPGAAYRSSTAYGAYEIAMMKRTIELEAETGTKLGGLVTWAFTFPGTSYFSGYRALATNGISLPVLSAFTLLGRLSGSRLPLSSSGARTLDDILANSVRDQPDVDGMATRDGDTIQVLVWNYHDEIVTAPAARVHLALTVPAGFGAHARVSHLRVDGAHGDAHAVWVTQGMPESPTAAQIAQLRQAMEPSLLVPETTVAVSPRGSVDLDFELPRFGVSLIMVAPTAAVTPPSEQPRGGCSFRVSGARIDGDALLAVAALVLVPIARRRPRVSELRPRR